MSKAKLFIEDKNRIDIMDHINLFQTNAEFLSAYTNDYVEPWVSFTMETSGLSYNKGQTPPHDYSQDYLTLEILSSGLVEPYYDGLYYSLDDGQTWNEFISNVNVANGDKFMLKGDNAMGAPGSNGPFMVKNCNFNVFGNAMSIVYSSDFATMTSFPTDYYDGLNSLFYGCSGLISAENLILPATTLASNCYGTMFQGCSSLTTAPELPATTLPSHCYYGMFRGCTSLTTAPVLPATTLAYGCYYDMFSGCTSLTTAPELPATTLADYCYDRMFYGCTGLTAAPELPATTLAEACYAGMFQGCTSLTSAPELPATTLTQSCYSNMFSGCTSLTTAPELSATTLVSDCYKSMFAYCRSLTAAPELPATTLANYCYKDMFYGCTLLNYIKCLATDISATSCTNNWVSGVASTGTFVKAASMTDWTTGVNGVPEGWTVQDAS